MTTSIKFDREAANNAGSLLAGFAASVHSYPIRDAVRMAGHALTYCELNDAADSLAARIRHMITGRDRRIGILLERSIDLVVSALAVLKAGCCYVPLDPANPTDRLQLILADSEPDLVLTSRALAGRLPKAIPMFYIERPAPVAIPEKHKTHAGPEVGPDACAYVIFTSGTTGRPKGVQISHRNVLHLFSATRSIFEFGPGNVWSMCHSFAFDFSVWEMWGALLHGGCVVVIPDLVVKDPAALRNVIRAEGVTMLSQTPTAFNQLIAEEVKHSDLLAVRHVVFGGEPLRFADLNPWIGKYGDEKPILSNMFGITETTVHASYQRVTRADLGERSSLIGKPLPGYGFMLVNDDLIPVPDGEAGEIVVTGGGVGQGYLRRPDANRERFIQITDQLGQTVRGYRSGDVARRRNDGHLEYVGRNDDQVKVRGFRIELGEVEAALTAHPAIRAAAVAVRDTPAGDKALTGYIVPATPPTETGLGERRWRKDLKRRLRKDLNGTLPDYMIPVAFRTLGSLPVTANGKLDRVALSRIDAPADATYGIPRSLREELLCDVFAQVLGRPAVGPEDDFFELGGHSLSAIRLTNRIRAVLGLEVTLEELFDSRTARALTHRPESTTMRPLLTPQERPNEIPLSHAQQRLWFLHNIHGATPANHLPYAFYLTGDLNIDALDAALMDVLVRHEILRTIYPEREGVPFQRILPPEQLTSPLRVTRATAQKVDDLLQDSACRGFDLASDLPLRASLFITGPEQCVLLLVLHHIAADGWSLDPLLHDLATAYSARCNNVSPAWSPLPLQYADYALWQRELLGETNDPASIAGEQLAFWTDYLRDAPDELELPFDRPRPHVPSFQGGRVLVNIEADLHMKLVALARSAGTTITMVLQAAVAGLLTRLGAGTDLPIGIPIAGRIDESVQAHVGFFVNTLVTRIDTSGNPTFAELLHRVRAASLAAYDHQDLPFERLVEALNPERLPSRHPLTQVAVGTQPGVSATVTLPGLAMKARPISNLTAKFDLAFRFEERNSDDGQPQGVVGALEYSTDLFDPSNAELIAERLIRLLHTIPGAPDTPLGQFDMLGTEERRRLDQWNNTSAPSYDAPNVGVLIERQVDRTPEAVAVIQGDVRWTYRELDEHANQIAHFILASGVTTPESMIGICLSRGPWFVAAMLGVWKAGAAYTPLEPRNPTDRLAYMLADCGAHILITEQGLCDEIPSASDIVTVYLDRDSRVMEMPVSRPVVQRSEPPSSSRRLAYAVYTSGSTGRPKCVLIEHHGVLCRLRDVVEGFRLTSDDINLQVISLGVEVPVREICGPLIVGGAVAMLPPNGERDPGIIMDTIRRVCPTIIMCVVHSLLEALLAYGVAASDFASVRIVGTGGEVLRPTEAAEVMNVWECELVNQYGPTETTMMCSGHTVAPNDLSGRIPIGRPLSNTRIYVLDDRLDLAPIGVTGEVYIAGRCVGRGFLGRPGLTAERFVADPFGEPGTRMYRCGDLARWRPDGNLEFIGRVDSQVRVRGFRVELGEIETVLLSHPKVSRAAVVVRDIGTGDRRLAAYVVPGSLGGITDQVTPAELRDHLTQRLLDQMIPATFTVLDALPLLSNGKLNRALLPVPGPAGEVSSRGPRSPHEEVLCTLFAGVLGLPRVGIDNDFFQLGGHSLLAARLIGQVRATLGIDLTMRNLFESPTVAGLALRLNDNNGRSLADNTGALEMMLALRFTGNRAPLFCIHPGGGLSWGYAGLLRYLDPDIPVYGVQARGLLHPDEMPATIEEMATDYIVRMQAIQPDGPYNLLGWSQGGIVAYEMAVQLQRCGIDIELLALLDTYPGVPDHFRVGDRTMLRSLIDPERADAVPARGSIEFATAMEIIRQDTGALASLTEPQVAALLKTMAHNRRIVRSYQPGSFDGDLTFFLAAHGRVDGAPTPDVWTEYISGEVISHTIPATHITMLDPEPVAEIGSILDHALSAVLARRAAKHRRYV